MFLLFLVSDMELFSEKIFFLKAIYYFVHILCVAHLNPCQQKFKVLTVINAFIDKESQNILAKTVFPKNYFQK